MMTAYISSEAKKNMDLNPGGRGQKSPKFKIRVYFASSTTLRTFISIG